MRSLFIAHWPHTFCLLPTRLHCLFTTCSLPTHSLTPHYLSLPMYTASPLSTLLDVCSLPVHCLFTAYQLPPLSPYACMHMYCSFFTYDLPNSRHTFIITAVLQHTIHVVFASYSLASHRFFIVQSLSNHYSLLPNRCLQWRIYCLSTANRPLINPWPIMQLLCRDNPAYALPITLVLCRLTDDSLTQHCLFFAYTRRVRCHYVITVESLLLSACALPTHCLLPGYSTFHCTLCAHCLCAACWLVIYRCLYCLFNVPCFVTGSFTESSLPIRCPSTPQSISIHCHSA
jgi:hypothetical protein